MRGQLTVLLAFLISSVESLLHLVHVLRLGDVPGLALEGIAGALLRARLPRAIRDVTRRTTRRADARRLVAGVAVAGR
jgi:hypothetical protein